MFPYGSWVASQASSRLGSPMSHVQVNAHKCGELGHILPELVIVAKANMNLAPV